jgi:hypothetical protein
MTYSSTAAASKKQGWGNFSKHTQYRQFLHMKFLPFSTLIPNKELAIIRKW